MRDVSRFYGFAQIISINYKCAEVVSHIYIFLFLLRILHPKFYHEAYKKYLVLKFLKAHFLGLEKVTSMDKHFKLTMTVQQSSINT